MKKTSSFEFSSCYHVYRHTATCNKFLTLDDQHCNLLQRQQLFLISANDVIVLQIQFSNDGNLRYWLQSFCYNFAFFKYHLVTNWNQSVAISSIAITCKPAGIANCCNQFSGGPSKTCWKEFQKTDFLEKWCSSSVNVLAHLPFCKHKTFWNALRDIASA